MCADCGRIVQGRTWHPVFPARPCEIGRGWELPRGSARDARATLGASYGSCSGEGGFVAHVSQETAMNRVHFAKWVPWIAFALAVPASALAPSDEAKQNPTSAATDQANAGSDTKNEDQSGAAKGKGHGPTAVMDRATPTQKSS